ncbi:NAD(P)H-hydrate dehydratase [Chiayiivirga flava]|uniref:Bifunctional NAD(P)H-hydrate repair enzyme n=1 Tax=Chiayiivirga flava TaxID=659595 RepID=A0A7W8D331_9GAMM|nr:NAD(P)H-hydrate dehydratase [Chiayiivirga flava]MBB5207004.1 NAD(P)H-hydrate epimerase [Chiayiivirga flava]
MHPPIALYRSDAIRAIDRRAIEHDGIDAYALMTRAAAAAFAALQRAWPSARRVCVLCGQGNNGGDGFVLARLARMAGLAVQVLVVDARAASTESARRAREQWQDIGGSTQVFEAGVPLPDCDLLVDAIFGIGLRRAPEGAAHALIEAINAADRHVLALDLPSGLDADSGSAPGAAVRAERTVTFIAHKQGLFTGRARALAGTVELAALGIAAATRDAQPLSAFAVDARHLARWLAPRRRDAHKGDHGHVLAIGGDSGMGGAVRLCAEAALRAGAGLVSVATRDGNVGAMLAARPELMPRAVDEPEVLRALLDRADVVALGPGLGRGDWSRDLFDAALAAALPTVLDADALNLLAVAPRALGTAVLTPHPGEAGRLLDCSAAQVEADRYAAAEALARRHAATVVLKGAGSIVAAPGHTPVVIAAGNPGMAGGGMGDVLTGVIAALLAQGMAPFDAACAGALLHAAAGDAAAREGGERGLLASDLFPHLRRLANP